MEDRLPRKLAAILYADVAGYSRLTGEDEDATHQQLRQSLDVLSTSIEHHEGRVVHYAGDAVLADFSTVSNALRCAVSVQNELRARNQDLPEERRLMFRIGLNLGEVIEDRGDLYGDGVNVAARLEGLAEPGGICISESVRTSAGKKLPLHYKFLGEQSVKNISSPVRAYTVYSEQPVAHDSPPPAAEDKPTVAILPFDNMSGTKDDEYFSDGITEDLITALSKNRWLSVVARNSTFVFKGQSVDVREVAQKLGAGYVVEGSVRRAGNKVRITAQLLDASSGNHIWAERYDRELNDIFVLQDEITGAIAGRIEPELETVERERVQRKPTRDLGAWDCYHLGMSQMYVFTKEGNREAQRMFRRATELDTRFAQPLARLAYCIALEMTYFDAEPSQGKLDEALDLAQRAVALDDQESFCHLAVARIHLARREYSLGLAGCEAALALNPHNAAAFCGLGDALAYSGRLEDSMFAFEEAIRLSPNDPWRFAFYSYGALASLLLGRFETAVTWARKAVLLPNCQCWGYAHLAAALSRLGNDVEARSVISELVRMKPEFSCTYARKYLFFIERDDQIEEYIDALRQAGLSE